MAPTRNPGTDKGITPAARTGAQATKSGDLAADATKVRPTTPSKLQHPEMQRASGRFPVLWLVVGGLVAAGIVIATVAVAAAICILIIVFKAPQKNDEVVNAQPPPPKHVAQENQVPQNNNQVPQDAGKRQPPDGSLSAEALARIAHQGIITPLVILFISSISMKGPRWFGR
jgi:hypothetical protein